MSEPKLVLFVSDAGAGHFLPVFKIAKATRDRGHRAVICTFDQRRAEVQAAGLGFISAGDFRTSWQSVPHSKIRVKRIVEVCYVFDSHR